MKAISLWQPWASLWLDNEHKKHETRHWSTNYRGELAVHAAKRPVDRDLGDDLEAILVERFGQGWRAEMPRGCLIGVVVVTACYRMDDRLFSQWAPTPGDRACGDWWPGRFAWRADRLRQFIPPIPFVGRQGFFEVPDELLVQKDDGRGEPPLDVLL